MQPQPASAPIEANSGAFVPLEHPTSLLSTHAAHPRPQRRVLPVDSGTDVYPSAFVLDGVLTRDECAHYVRACERGGFHSLEREFPRDYRSNDRVLHLAPPAVVDELFRRLVGGFRAEDALAEPYPAGCGGVWHPRTLNECFKFARYRPGCAFAPHADSHIFPRPGLCTVYTVVIYLNDADSDGELALRGGETEFLRERPQSECRSSSSSASARSRIAESLDSSRYEVLAAVRPRAGSALVFRHELLHQAAPVLAGLKYIVRTEIGFERLPSVLTEQPSSLLAAGVAQRAAQLYDRTDAMEAQLAAAKAAAAKSESTNSTPALPSAADFVETYLEALDVQMTHYAQQDNARRQLERLAAASGLSSALWLRVLRFVDRRSLIRCARACRGLYRLVRQPSLWLDHAMPHATPESLATDWSRPYAHDWQHRYVRSLMQSVRVAAASVSDVFGAVDAPRQPLNCTGARTPLLASCQFAGDDEVQVGAGGVARSFLFSFFFFLSFFLSFCLSFSFFLSFFLPFFLPLYLSSFLSFFLPFFLSLYFALIPLPADACDRQRLWYDQGWIRW